VAAQAQTSFDRLCATSVITEEDRQALEQLRQGINPRRLRVEILELTDAILRLPGAKESPGTENVYLTLHIPSRAIGHAGVNII